MRSFRAIASAVALIAALAACGGGDDTPTATSPTVPASTEAEAPADTTPASTPGTPAPGDGPAATVSPDLPSELVGEVGPIEIVGESLPVLGEADPATDPAVGKPAPVVIGENFAGETVRIDPATDGPTLVVFLAHWCPHCNREVPRINELRDAGRFPEGLNIVGVSTALNSGRPNFPPSKWFVDMDWTYPVIADGIDFEREVLIAADAYGVDGFPFVVLVGGDGKVLARWSGERSADEFAELVDTYLPST